MIDYMEISVEFPFDPSSKRKNLEREEIAFDDIRKWRKEKLQQYFDLNMLGEKYKNLPSAFLIRIVGDDLDEYSALKVYIKTPTGLRLCMAFSEVARKSGVDDDEASPTFGMWEKLTQSFLWATE